MSNIVPDNSNTIFSIWLKDLKNLLVFFNDANNYKKTMDDYALDSDIDIASTARELKRSLDDIENGKHLETAVSKIPQKSTNTTVTRNVKTNMRNISKEQTQKIEESKITDIEHDLDER